MSNITKAIAALGVVAGLGVAAMPLSTYAAQTTVPVSATVDGTISISTSAEEVNVGNVIPGGDVAYEDLTVTVTSNGTNAGYNLNIKDSDGVTALMSGSNSIPAGSPAKGNSAWGYAVVSTDGTVGTYTAVTTAGANIANATNNGAALASGKSASTVLRFGVSAEADQAAGTYTGGVILTATAKSA